MSEPTAPIVDREVVDDLRRSTGDDDAFVLELIETYFADGADQLAQIERAVTAGDAAAAVRPAHTLKSSSLSLGAIRLGEISRDLEQVARLDDVEAVRSTSELARAAWGPTVEELRAVLELTS